MTSRGRSLSHCEETCAVRWNELFSLKMSAPLFFFMLLCHVFTVALNQMYVAVME